MNAVTATEIAKAIDRYKDETQREPLAITPDQGPPTGNAEAIQGAKMNPAHDHLNALLDESPKE